MERFMVNYTSKSLYKDMNDIIYFIFSFSYRKNKSSVFRYHFVMLFMRFFGGYGLFGIIQLVRLTGMVLTMESYIICGVIIIPHALLLLMPKQSLILVFYLLRGSSQKNLSMIFSDSYFEMFYYYGLSHKYGYSDLKKVVETEKIIKFYPGPYIVKKYLEPDSLNAMCDVLSCRLGKRYILDKKVTRFHTTEGEGQ